MVAEYWGHIKHDFIYLSLFTFALLFGIYLIIMRVHVYKYTNSTSRKPVHYKMFRPYDKSLISNAPSKREKQFYITTNKITWLFNTLMIAAFIIYLYLVFMR